VNSNSAAIVTEQTARVNGDNANASSITTLSVTVGNNTSAITNEQIVRANGDSANATSISNLSVTVGNNTSAITNEQIARANGDSANATSISNLSATVGSHTASISTLQSVQADHTGKLAAYFSIVAAAGANPAYVIVNASTYGSAIALAASSIALYDNSSGNALKVMEVIGGYAHFSRLIIIDGGGMRKVEGPVFGAANNLVMWFGPDSVDPSAATIANSHFAQATDGKTYFGGADLATQTGGGPYLTLDHTAVGVTGASGTTLTAGPVIGTLNNPVGTVSYAWNTSEPRVTVTSPTTGGTSFQAQVTAGETLGSFAVCTATDAGTGRMYQLTCRVRFTSNA
jgi:hypothetical protein